MAKKYVKENDRQILFGDFTLEIQIVKPDPKTGNNIKGILWYADEPYPAIASDMLYATIEEARIDFMYVLIPAFMFNAETKHGEVRDIEFIDNDHMIEQLIDRFLYDFRETIFYGIVIDIHKMLANYGYIMPDRNDYIQNSAMENYYIIVDKINKRLLERLAQFGFSPDRNTYNISDQKDTLFYKDDRCKNIVFTRYPYTPGFRMAENAQVFNRHGDGDYIRNTDVKLLNKKYFLMYERMVTMESKLRELVSSVNEVYEDTGFQSVINDFSEQVNKDRNKLVAFWRKQKPETYKKFIKEYSER